MTQKTPPDPLAEFLRERLELVNEHHARRPFLSLATVAETAARIDHFALVYLASGLARTSAGRKQLKKAIAAAHASA